MDPSTIAQIVTWTLTIAIVSGAIIADTQRNPMGHPKNFTKYRTLNWCLIGFSYALSYMGRYNINVLSGYSQLEQDFGVNDLGIVITVGFWAYAVFVVMNGFIVDRIGAKKGIMIGTSGSGMMNVVMGAYIYGAQKTNFTGTKFVVVLSILYAINNFFQTFSTSSICKAGVNWYHISERGFFSGIFGVVISFGFFLSFQVNGLILDVLPTPFLFYIPAITLFIMFFLDWMVTSAIPEHKFTADELFTLRGDDPQIRDARPPFREVIKPILSQKIFYFLGACEILIGWFRDGILSWYPSYFNSLGDDTNSIPYILAANGVTIGGMFGSLLAGVISDLFCNAQRQPVALFNTCGVFVMQFIFVFVYQNDYAGSVMIGLISIFFSGVHGIITSTCAMDFAGHGATGTASGLLDGIQKIGSGLTGAPMGAIIDKWGYQGWIISMMPASGICAILFTIILKVRSAEHLAMDGKSENKKLLSDDIHEDIDVKKGDVEELV
ncbi:putative multi-domain containing protein [Aduncisulcus paluster]|uniref:Multi-domain containing protein n=1 Tax=Aduncisulcus paluster TaxID=2918883 RepID=A0ABQ5KSB5_9EUKA|nr:putative multi-domain containing protein [Aduncisulcus paluster]